MIRISRHPRGRRARARLGRDESGQGMVELALILPVLLLILVGILEFGLIYSNVISMRQGIREAGRQGSVASFGSADPDTCLPGGTGSRPIKRLLCMAKDQAGVGDSVRVRLKFATSDLAPGGTYQIGDAIVVCGIYPISSLTGLFQPFLNGRYARTTAAFRIEQLLRRDGSRLSCPPPRAAAGGRLGRTRPFGAGLVVVRRLRMSRAGTGGRADNVLKSVYKRGRM